MSIEEFRKEIKASSEAYKELKDEAYRLLAEYHGSLWD